MATDLEKLRFHRLQWDPETLHFSVLNCTPTFPGRESQSFSLSRFYEFGLMLKSLVTEGVNETTKR